MQWCLVECYVSDCDGESGVGPLGIVEEMVTNRIYASNTLGVVSIMYIVVMSIVMSVRMGLQQNMICGHLNTDVNTDVITSKVLP